MLVATILTVSNITNAAHIEFVSVVEQDATYTTSMNEVQVATNESVGAAGQDAAGSKNETSVDLIQGLVSLAVCGASSGDFKTIESYLGVSRENT